MWYRIVGVEEKMRKKWRGMGSRREGAVERRRKKERNVRPMGEGVDLK